MKARNKRTRKPYQVSLGVGGAAFRYGQYDNVNELFIVAAQDMYQHKEESKEHIDTREGVME
jgi:hypothetical protein